MISRGFVVRRASETEAESVAEFLRPRAGKHLVPRDPAFLAKVCEANALFVATHEGQLAATSYVLPPPDGKGQPVYEFGGVLVDAPHKGFQLADVVGFVALASQFAYQSPSETERMIAHVHERNEKPRAMLRRLGFCFHGRTEVFEDDDAPENLERNDELRVVAHLFEFPFQSLSVVADWLERFDSRATGRSGVARITLAVPELTEEPQNAVTALRATAAGWRASP